MISNLEKINVNFEEGYIYLKSNNKLEKINVNFEEKLFSLKNYLNKIHNNYILEFNNKILSNNYDNLTLDEIGIKFDIKQSHLNTLIIK